MGLPISPLPYLLVPGFLVVTLSDPPPRIVLRAVVRSSTSNSTLPPLSSGSSMTHITFSPFFV